MEKDLFPPIKEYFENLGYVCDGEVDDIDLYMENSEGESIAVELKLTLDFKSVQQAAQRQKITDKVYIGIFKPSDVHSGSFRDKLYILKRLGIGLIVVSKRSKSVEIASEPVVTELSKYQSYNKKKKKEVSKEFKRRRVKNNTGGVHGVKLVTGYREDALLVLDAMAELGGEASGSEAKKISGVYRSTAIMHNNYYGWFENVKKGIYRVTDAGYAALEEFEDTVYALKRGTAENNTEKISAEKISAEKISAEKISTEKIITEKISTEKIITEQNSESESDEKAAVKRKRRSSKK